MRLVMRMEMEDVGRCCRLGDGEGDGVAVVRLA